MVLLPSVDASVQVLQLLEVGGKEEREVDVRIVSQSNADVGSNFGFDEECVRRFQKAASLKFVTSLNIIDA